MKVTLISIAILMHGPKATRSNGLQSAEVKIHVNVSEKEDGEHSSDNDKIGKNKAVAEISCGDVVKHALRRACTFGCSNGKICKCPAYGHGATKTFWVVDGEHEDCTKSSRRKFDPDLLQGKGCYCREWADDGFSTPPW